MKIVYIKYKTLALGENAPLKPGGVLKSPIIEDIGFLIEENEEAIAIGFGREEKGFQQAATIPRELILAMRIIDLDDIGSGLFERLYSRGLHPGLVKIDWDVREQVHTVTIGDTQGVVTERDEHMTRGRAIDETIENTINTWEANFKKDTK